MRDDDNARFRSALEKAMRDLGLERLTAVQLDLLGRHYSMMLQWNRHINLTRIAAPDQAARFHYAESLFGALFVGGPHTVLDVGSGAGFPAVPIAITRSE